MSDAENRNAKTPAERADDAEAVATTAITHAAAAEAHAAAAARSAEAVLSAGEDFYSRAAKGGYPVSKNDYYRYHYQEYLNQYRFYGSLRAGVAWAPATIVVAAVAFLSDNFQTDQNLLTVMVGVVLLLIFLINVFLQRQQMVHQWMAGICDQMVREPAVFENDQLVLRDHKWIRDTAAEKFSLGKHLREAATILLFLFLVTLFMAVVISVQPPWYCAVVRAGGRATGWIP